MSRLQRQSEEVDRGSVDDRNGGCDTGSGVKNKNANGALVDSGEFCATIRKVPATKQVAREVGCLGDAKEDDWKEVKRRRRSNRIPGRGKDDRKILGTSKQADGLKSILRTVSLYVTRLSPETTAADIEGLLAERSPGVKAEEMRSRYPEVYKSYKVAIDETHFDAVMLPEVWPVGVRVDRYFHWRGGRREMK